MQDAEIRRVKTSHFIVRNSTIYRLYTVRLKLDGKEMEFNSEEHAKTRLEDREPKFKAFVTP